MLPSTMDKSEFVAAFGRVFEHSPWIAGRTWDSGLDRRHDSLPGLHQAFGEVIRSATRDEQLSLLRAHPELAAREADAEDLTAHSRGEQRGAGLDRCRPDEFTEFRHLNEAYRQKFGFPFIIAVKGLDRRRILARFRSRLQNDPETEFEEALDQVIRIGYFRLEQLLPEHRDRP